MPYTLEAGIDDTPDFLGSERRRADWMEHRLRIGLDPATKMSIVCQPQ